MTFDAWITYIFDHTVTESKWYRNPNAPFWDRPPAVIVEYLTRVFAHADTVLQPFSDAQAAQGLWAIVSNDVSEYAYSLLETSVPLPARLACVEAMHALFQDYFARRCTSHLSHLDKVTTPAHVSPLNVVCYMWWDVLPLHGLAHIRPEHPDGPELDRAIFSVIRRSLDIPSVACQESALHGLWEWSPYRDETDAIAAQFLRRPTTVDPGLRAFAGRLTD